MKIPVIITRELLVFPHTVTPILIARPFSLRAAREALSLDRKALFIPQKDSAKERPEDKNDVYEIGTIGRFIQYVNAPDGSIRAIIEGLERVSLKELYYKDELFRAEYQHSPIEAKVDEEALQLSRILREYYSNYSKQVHSIPDEVTLTILDQSNDPYVIANVLAAHLPINFEEKIEIYKIDNLKELLKKLISILIRELEFHRLKLEIEERVTQEIRKNQKQYFLQQQMKEIQKELGLKEESEFEALEKQIKESLMPEDVKKKALHELSKLRRTPSISPEATVIRNYLDWLINLPWGRCSKDNLDIKHARKVLDEDHFGLEEQKERILEYLAVLKLKGQIRGQVICFVGPPGVGKTSLARSIARALGRKFVRISLGGMRDEAEIRGHRRTYVGAMPGRIIQQIRRAGTQNPVFLLDEIDKVGTDWRGDPQAALMEVLDPEINKYFQDNYLEVDFDLSKVLFITTANSLYGIPRPLLDRMEVIPIKGYLDFEKLHIARDYLLSKKLKEAGLNAKIFRIEDKAILRIIREYTREAGLRELERQIARIVRKVAKKYAEKGKGAFITEKNLEKYLGLPRHRPRDMRKSLPPGVAIGLAWTEFGGDILNIEVKRMSGRGNLELTGQLGDVMKESAKAALTYIRSNYKKFNLPKDFYRNIDLHLHVPEGAIPKDGPSAGIAILAAMISSLTGKSLPPDIAMTGEITITGQVLAVGGLEEKILAAKRYGIRKIFLPKENEIDIKEMKKEITRNIELVYVADLNSFVSHLLSLT